MLLLLLLILVCSLSGASAGRALSSIQGLVFRLPRAPPTSTTLTPPVAARRRRGASSKAFTRLTRLEGLETWTTELRLGGVNASSSSSSLLVELGKAMLYSGCPDEALEMYRSLSPFFQEEQQERDSKLTSVALRAMIALGDEEGALSLLRSSSSEGRHSILADDDALSFLLADFAKTSASGLCVALDLRLSLLQRGGRLGAHGVAGLLRGVWEHGLGGQSSASQSPLLLDSAAQGLALAKESRDAFRLAPAAAESLAFELLRELVNATSTPTNATKTAPVAVDKRTRGEFLRVVFQSAALQTKPVLNRNFEATAALNREAEALGGLRAATLALSKFGLPWDSHTADVLVDECLKTGDISAVNYIIAQMNVLNLYAGTPTFNSVLKRYAESGDGESAYQLLAEMREQPHTEPDAESLALVLEACALTERGRHLSRDLISQLDAGDGDGDDATTISTISKPVMDRWAELQVLSRLPYGTVIEKMAACGTAQPDFETVLLLFRAFGRVGDWRGALNLYDLQQMGTKRRSEMRSTALSSTSSSSSSSSTTFEFSATLPPVNRATLVGILTVLRDLGRPAEAAKVLLQQPRELATTEAFALALEACSSTTAENLKLLEKTRLADLALALFAEFERRDQRPDRRIMAALIRTFALRGDVPSALGVYEEMLEKFSPDCRGLQNIIDVCLEEPQYLRTLCVTLERLAEKDSIDLAVFSGDLLMQAFSDSRKLGVALTAMEDCCEAARVQERVETVFCSLDVLSVLVAGAIQESQGGEASLSAVMRQLGNKGIAPDADTMDYFRVASAAEPAKNSPGSSHYNKKLRPNGLKQASLLDLEPPEGFAQAAPGVKRSGNPQINDREPYFKAGGGEKFRRHVDLMRRGGEAAAAELWEPEEEQPNNLTEEQQLAMAEAALELGPED